MSLLVLCFSAVSCGSTPKDKEKKDNPPEEEVKPEKLKPARPLSSDFDYLDFKATSEPIGVNVSYYSDIYSRGFAWFTDENTTDTKLYLVESGLNYDADFSNATVIDGSSLLVKYSNGGKSFEAPSDSSYEKVSKSGSGDTLNLNVHKVHVENLKKNTSYSYKIGSESGWKYGAFTTEVENPTSVTAIQLSDAQTYEPSLLTTFRSTIQASIATVGEDLDFLLYNGDYFDQNMKKVNDSSINNILRYTKASDAIEDFKSMIPFMASSGNHEPTAPYSAVLGSDINYGAFDYKGGNYSYNYGPVHFIVLNSNRLADDDLADEDYVAQMNWLKSDLNSDDSKNANWRIVMMHISCFSTGDHSKEDDNMRLVERLSPLFSEHHVDLVLQAHDHTYSKTLPYKWDAAGYSQTYGNSDVVEFNPQTREIDGRTFDLNPKGTYYVTTGAAGHRVCSYSKDGKNEYEDGIYAEVTVDSSGNIQPADSSKTYRNNKYKCEVGKLNCTTQLNSYTTSKGIVVDGFYEAGDPATGCVDGQMFGVLNVNEDTLTYDVYIIKAGASEVTLFDTLSILHE